MLIVLTGCATPEYKKTAEGKFKGDLDVRWTENDLFLYLPSATNSLTFTRSDGTVIQPGRMVTDGGSIPRLRWGFKGLSPWGYAPAYVVHDWLFRAKHCQIEPDNHYVFGDSVAILAEGLKAVMERDVSVRDYFVFGAIVEGVSSS